MKLKNISNATLQIMFGKTRQECSTVEINSLANMLTPSQMALCYPGCLLQKVQAVKAPRDLYNLATKQVSFKQRTQNNMVTKDWTTNAGLARFPNTAHKTILLMNGDISQEQVATFKKKMSFKQNNIG